MSEMEWLDIFAGNLLDMMVEAGHSQHSLANVTGLSQASISRYLAARQMPTIKAIINIAYALDCDIVDLIDFGDTIDQSYFRLLEFA